jgi:DNA-binding FadR family transcriptional regulator
MKYNQPIPRRKLAHEVRDRLLAMIESGDLACGDKMPSEHTIMDMFKVGRPAVREALQSLEGLGVISISHGERATVCAINAETILGQILSAIEKKTRTSQPACSATTSCELIRCTAHLRRFPRRMRKDSTFPAG